jgi:DNA-binding HxlR family transcriptional regulator
MGEINSLWIRFNSFVKLWECNFKILTRTLSDLQLINIVFRIIHLSSMAANSGKKITNTQNHNQHISIIEDLYNELLREKLYLY